MPDFAAMPAALAPSATEASNAPTSVSLFDQGLIQVLEAAVSGLQPKQPYVVALAENPDGAGVLQPLQSFMTNPAGAAPGGQRRELGPEWRRELPKTYRPERFQRVKSCVLLHSAISGKPAGEGGPCCKNQFSPR
jgi:hypothetical protein